MDELEVGLEPIQQTETTTILDQFWIDYIDAQHEFHLFITIGLGLIIGLLCVLILKGRS